jgi:hypothetical protein
MTLIHIFLLEMSNDARFKAQEAWWSRFLGSPFCPRYCSRFQGCSSFHLEQVAGTHGYETFPIKHIASSTQPRPQRDLGAIHPKEGTN